MARQYIPTIGLEVHVQLKTRSQDVLRLRRSSLARSRTRTPAPSASAIPGALPVMNEQALQMTALTGLMLGCEIAEVCKFDRKNYFYPDMPKNYQITQYDQPICLRGGVPLHDLAYPKDAQKAIAQPGKSIGLMRIHLEEDVAKSFHFETSTGIDFNRAGTPLMEIVSEPDIDTPEEAFAYLTALQQILIYGGVSDADMEKGQLRCDCNVSVRPEGQEELGTKIEIKNMNTISGVRRALAYEIERQTEVLRGGGTLQQETRRWDDDSGQTFLMRIKGIRARLPLLSRSRSAAGGDRRFHGGSARAPAGAAGGEARALRAAVRRDRVRRQRAGERSRSSPRISRRPRSGAKKPKNVANWILNDLQSALAGAGQTHCGMPDRRRTRSMSW